MNRVDYNTNPLWRIRLFDGPILEDASGNEVRHFRSQRVGALLAYLALHVGRPCAREELYAALWPNDDDRQVVANRLRFTLASLRRQLEPPGVSFGSVLDVSDPGRVRLRTETVWSDVAALERALKNRRNGEAAHLLRGTLLPGYYDEWILDARLRFELLSDDLEWEEMPERADADGVRSPPVPETPRHRLPLYLTRFFGRQTEQQQLRERIAANRLVTLTGPGGIGKTRLAVETAREMDSASVFVSLADLPGSAGLPEAALQALLIAPQAGVDPVEHLIAALQRRDSLLLILDNAEHLVHAVIALSLRLLEAVPGLRLLITSRQRLDVPGEAMLSLEPLEAPRHASGPERLLEFPAIALFLDRARNARPDFTLTTRHVSPLVEICRRLEGMPLALELAAARVTTQTPAQIAAALSTHLMDLTSHQYGLPARHRSLRAAVQGSFDLLPPLLQAFFATLSVFHGGWTVEAASAVTGSEDVAAFLEELVLRSLAEVREDEATGVNRYSFLETLRQFAAEKLSEAEYAPPEESQTEYADRLPADFRETARRHAHYFLSVAERSAPLVAQGASAILAELEREHENLRAALRWAFEAGELDIALRFAHALSGFWATHGHLSDGRRCYESLLTASDGAPARTRAVILLGCGIFATRQNELNAAKQYVVQSLALYREEGDESGILKGTQALGDACRLGGELVMAAEHYRAGLALCETIGSESDLAKCHHGLGVLSIYTGEYDAAGSHLEIALNIRRKMAHLLEVARTQNLLAFAISELGDLNAAERMFRTCMETFIEHGDRWYQSSTMNGLAHIAYARGETEVALGNVENGLAIMREIGSQESVASLLSFLAHIHVKLGRLEDARRATRESLGVATRIQNTQSLAMALSCSSALLEAQGQYEPSAQLLAAAISIYEQLGLRPNRMGRTIHEAIHQTLLSALGQSRFDAAGAAGQSLSPEAAADFGLLHLGP